SGFGVVRSSCRVPVDGGRDVCLVCLLEVDPLGPIDAPLVRDEQNLLLGARGRLNGLGEVVSSDPIAGHQRLPRAVGNLGGLVDVTHQQVAVDPVVESNRARVKPLDAIERDASTPSYLVA